MGVVLKMPDTRRYVQDNAPLSITKGQRRIILNEIEKFQVKYKGSDKFIDDLEHLKSLLLMFTKPVEV